jgi:hypothetical protein
MFEYYKILNNAWKKEVKESARFAIKALSDIPKHERVKDKHIDDIVEIINQNLGVDFQAEVTKPAKAFIQRSMQLGLNDAQRQVPSNIGIGLYGLSEHKLSNIITKQNSFWVGNHFDADIADRFKQTMKQAIDSGFTREMLQNKLKEQFNDLKDKSAHYWQGLAEHTALRIREFGRLEGYRKAGAKHYRLVVVIDKRTSEICKALASENKLYPLDVAIEVMENLNAIDPNKHSLDTARDYMKAIAPWVSDKQIIRNSNDEPIGVSGSHTPFPPFHWKCRTTTEIVI